MLVPKTWNDLPRGLRETIFDLIDDYVSEHDGDEEPTLSGFDVDLSAYTREKTLTLHYGGRSFHVEFYEEDPSGDADEEKDEDLEEDKEEEVR